ncbi:MAG: hypothetical protein ACM3YF_01135 [Candidatus Zixiibacteriota bacterium]
MKTFGEFYREDVLTKKPLVKRVLPPQSDDIKVVKDLFGWKLHSGKQFIDCRSEEEAKFLKIFLEVGFEEVKVPKDDKILKELLTELEEMKQVADELIEEQAEGLFSRRIKEELRHRVWQELTK